MNQPEALRLADLWEKHSHGYARTPEAKTAAELRRLYAQRDALLEALKLASAWVEEYISQMRAYTISEQADDDLSVIYAAIAAVEGENHAKNL